MATNNPVNEVHSNDNQIFDNVDYQLSQEIHQEEHLDSDAETEIDDNTIPYHQYLLDTEAQNVPTEVSADTSDKVSMIAILTDLQTQLDGHAKVNQEKCLEIETLNNELLQCKQEICRLDTHKVKLDLENKVRQEQALVIQRNKRNAELVQENDLLKSTLSGKEKSIAFLQSEKEKILSEKKDLADSYLDEIVCLKNANKVARDMLQRFNMPTQTIPMLSKKPKAATADLHKDLLGRNVSLENDGMMTGKANTHSRTANTEKLSALTAELKAGKPRVTVVKKVVDLSTSETRQIACSRNVQLRFTHNNSDCQAVLGSKGISLVVQRLFYGYLDSGCSRTYDPVDSARLINFVEKLLVPLKIWHDEYCIGSLASLLKNDFCAKSTELETYCFYSQGRRPVLPCIRTPEPTCVLPYKEKQVARFVSRLPMVHLPQQLFRRALLAVTENLLPHQYSLQTLHPKDLLIPEHPSHVYRLQEKLSMDSNSAPPVDDGDNMSFFLGLQISQNPPRHLYAYQSKYAQEILKKFGFDSCSPIDTPMAERPNLDEDKGGKLIDPTRFRGMVGLLMFLMCSRPDIVFALAGPPKKRRKGKKYCTSPLQRHECIAYQDVVLKSSGAVLYSETIGFASAGRPGLTGFVLCVS
ncbi:retrovirus-related pol polyprotein from transposon TNT 1-94 [Tanacetum coccineum]